MLQRREITDITYVVGSTRKGINLKEKNRTMCTGKVKVHIDGRFSFTVGIKDLDKLNLLKLAYGGKVLGSSCMIFTTAPAVPKK